MSPERWQLLQDIYHAALERKPEDRAAFLECVHDSGLRHDVEALLVEVEREGILDTPLIKPSEFVSTAARPEQLASYRILTLLGKGGMGEVYHAKDMQLGREVALKVVPTAIASGEDHLRRFEEEARLASSLNHPNIVTIYGIGREGGFAFIAMELIRGHTLRELLTEGALPTSRALAIAVQVAEAIVTAHQCGIMHRDLKPENIMVTVEGRVKVLDFGLAKRRIREGMRDGSPEDVLTEASLTEKGMIVGTVGYMSPEQAAGRPLTQATDQFSFGTVLYEMLSGRRAFQKATAVETMAAIINEQPAPLQDLNPAVTARLRDAVERCLGKDPAGRYAATMDLAAEIRALVDQEEPGRAMTTAMPDSRPMSRPARRFASGVTRRQALSVASAVIVVGSGVATWKLWPRFTGIQTLAVLPFESASNDEETEAFSIGLTENLIRKLAGLPGLMVKSRAAVSTYRGKNSDPRTAGQQLGVDAIVNGSVKRRAGNLHITVELIDTRTAAVLWGPTSYDRGEAELQVTGDEIAGAIVQDAVRLKLSPENRSKLAHHATNNGEADRLYRLALLHLDKETKDDYLTARSLLRQAIELDGKFALAYIALAFTYSSMAIDGYESPAEAMLQNKLCANMALQLDSTIVEAHAQLGTELFWGQWRWREAEREFEIAARSPGAPVYEPYVYLLWATRRADEAWAMIRHALHENPVSLKWRLREADLLLARDRADEAERAYREVIRDTPEDRRAYLGLAQVKRKQKQFADAIVWLRRGYELAGETDPVVLDLLKHAQDEVGFVEIGKREAQLELDYLRGVPSTQYVSPLDVARAYARLGDRNQTFRYVDLAFEEHSPGLALLNVDPAWDLVRDDTRFDDARKRVGLP